MLHIPLTRPIMPCLSASKFGCAPNVSVVRRTGAGCVRGLGVLGSSVSPCCIHCVPFTLPNDALLVSKQSLAVPQPVSGRVANWRAVCVCGFGVLGSSAQSILADSPNSTVLSRGQSLRRSGCCTRHASAAWFLRRRTWVSCSPRRCVSAI